MISPTGCVISGEFNSLRCRGSTRPLSSVQDVGMQTCYKRSLHNVSHDLRFSHSQTIMHMYMCIHVLHIDLLNGDITAEIPSDAVGKSLLLEIEKWMKDGAKYDIICRFCPKTVPPGYPYSTRISGMYM